MNKEPFKKGRRISQFFYENILFDYVNKDLSDEDRSLMKELTAKGVDNKKHLGSVLLALEYLNKIRTVELKVTPEPQKSSFVKFIIRQRFKFLFLILTSLFIVSGYYLVRVFS